MPLQEGSYVASGHVPLKHHVFDLLSEFVQTLAHTRDLTKLYSVEEKHDCDQEVRREVLHHTAATSALTRQPG